MGTKTPAEHPCGGTRHSTARPSSAPLGGARHPAELRASPPSARGAPLPAALRPAELPSPRGAPAELPPAGPRVRLPARTSQRSRLRGAGGGDGACAGLRGRSAVPHPRGREAGEPEPSNRRGGGGAEDGVAGRGAEGADSAGSAASARLKLLRAEEREEGIMRGGLAQ